MLKNQFKNFHKKAGEIVKKTQTQPKKSKQETNENIIAKLFEEVKIMFENLPSRIENRIDPESKRKRRRFHPRMFEEMLPSLNPHKKLSIFKN